MARRRIVVYPLVFAEGYFIHRKGFIFYKDRSHIIEAKLKNGLPHVTIGFTEYNLFNLMIEYFMLGTKIESLKGYSLSWRPTKKYPNRVSYGTIRITKKEDETFVPDNVLTLYSCAKKAQSANSRCIEILTDMDVARAIIRHRFKCRYCGDKINRKTWHLDHIRPLAQLGKNVPENIAPACKMCNIMKGALMEQDFFAKCLKIINNPHRKNSSDSLTSQV